MTQDFSFPFKFSFVSVKFEFFRDDKITVPANGLNLVRATQQLVKGSRP